MGRNDQVCYFGVKAVWPQIVRPACAKQTSTLTWELPEPAEREHEAVPSPFVVAVQVGVLDAKCQVAVIVAPPTPEPSQTSLPKTSTCEFLFGLAFETPAVALHVG